MRTVLRDLGVDFDPMTVDAARRDPLPAGLLVSTANHAVPLERRRQSADPSRRPLHLVVMTELSRTMRRTRERSTCDVVVSTSGFCARGVRRRRCNLGTRGC